MALMPCNHQGHKQDRHCMKYCSLYTAYPPFAAGDLQETRAGQDCLHQRRLTAQWCASRSSHTICAALPAPGLAYTVECPSHVTCTDAFARQADVHSHPAPECTCQVWLCTKCIAIQSALCRICEYRACNLICKCAEQTQRPLCCSSPVHAQTPSQPKQSWNLGSESTY